MVYNLSSMANFDHLHLPYAFSKANSKKLVLRLSNKWFDLINTV